MIDLWLDHKTDWSTNVLIYLFLWSITYLCTDLLIYKGLPMIRDDYEKIGAEIGKLVQEKQQAYGDSFNKSCEVLKVLYPDGVSVDKYKDFLTVTRVIDKLFRIATDRDALGESPWRDVAGYAILSIAHSEELEFDKFKIPAEAHPHFDIAEWRKGRGHTDTEAASVTDEAREQRRRDYEAETDSWVIDVNGTRVRR